jgi:malonate-semialdehyde dehydrogenase (acetylating)/methylmalonate-semialdehyde dehydrogenase
MSFTGNKKSFLGDINMYGKNGINFFTQHKSIVSRWKVESDASQKLTTAMPTHK